MGNNSIPLPQSVWVTPWGLRRGLRVGGRPDEARKPTVREKQGGGLEVQARAGRSELSRAGG